MKILATKQNCLNDSYLVQGLKHRVACQIALYLTLFLTQSWTLHTQQSKRLFLKLIQFNQLSHALNMIWKSWQSARPSAVNNKQNAIFYRHHIDSTTNDLRTLYSVKMTVFWVVTPCSLVEVHCHFRGACCLHHQIALIMEAASTSETSMNFYHTQCNNPKDSHLHTCHYENPKTQLYSAFHNTRNNISLSLLTTL
jgi:hypothetical protein